MIAYSILNNSIIWNALPLTFPTDSIGPTSRYHHDKFFANILGHIADATDYHYDNTINALYHKGRLCVPQALIQTVLDDFHISY